MDNSERKELQRSEVEVSRLFKGEYQKENSQRLELKQRVTTISYYKSVQYNDNMNDALFEEKDFGASENEYKNTETRVAWIDVPEFDAQGNKITEEKCKALIGPNACIYKVLSHQPILTDKQQQAINNGLRSLDQFAMSQIVRHPESGEIILFNEKPMYRRTFFSKTQKEDVDYREGQEAYIPIELVEELEGASIHADQKI